MRFLTYLAVFICFAGSQAMAQTYYNSPSSGSSTLYNAPSGGYGGNAPINLKAMTRGKVSKPAKNTGYTYKGQAYGVDRSSYSLALSPEQARQNTIKRERAAVNREREKAKLRAEIEAKRKNGTLTVEEETQAFLSEFQDTPTKAVKSEPRKKVIYYNKRNNDPIVPKRVFNTPY